MKNTKFIVKVDRGGSQATEYVQRIDRTPIQMTSDRKLALVRGDSPPRMPSNRSKLLGAARSWYPFRSAPNPASH